MKTKLEYLTKFLNSKEETTTKEVAQALNWNVTSLSQYIYILEQAGYIFRYGEIIHRREKIPHLRIEEFKKIERDPDYLKERLDRLKETALTKEFMQSLTFIEAMYLVQAKRTSFTTKEVAELIGKNQQFIATSFRKLVNLGFLTKKLLVYTIIKPIPITSQTDLCRALQPKKVEPIKPVVKIDLEREKAEEVVRELGYKIGDSDYLKYVDFIYESMHCI